MNQFQLYGATAAGTLTPVTTDASGNVVTTPSAAAQPIFRADTYAARLNTLATVTVKNTPGTFVGFLVNSLGTSATVSVFDNLTGTGTAVAVVTLAGRVSGDFVKLEVAFNTGITLVMGGTAAGDITPVYR